MRLLRCERGVTAIEYGVLSALIAVAGVGATEAAGGKIKATFCSIAGSFGTGGACSTETVEEPPPPPPPVLTPQEQCVADKGNWFVASTGATICGPTAPTAPAGEEWYVYNGELCKALGGTASSGSHITGVRQCRLPGDTRYRPIDARPQ